MLKRIGIPVRFNMFFVPGYDIKPCLLVRSVDNYLMIYVKKFCRWLVVLIATPAVVFIIWQGGIYSLWRIQRLFIAYDLIPPETLNNYGNPDPEFTRVARLELKISHLDTRLMQITSGIPLIDFFAGAHEKEQLLTETIALYSQIIDQSTWKNSDLLSTYYLNRGTNYSLLGQHQKALDDYNKALSLSPQDSTTRLNRGYEYEMMGLPEQALSDLELFLQGTASYPKLWQFHRENAQKQVDELRQRLGRHG